LVKVQKTNNMETRAKGSGFKMKAGKEGPMKKNFGISPVKDIKNYGAYSSAEEKAAAKEHNLIHRGKVPGTKTITIYPKNKKQK